MYREETVLLVPLSPKVNRCANKSEVKDPSINTSELAQFDRHGTGTTTVLGLKVQALLEVIFFAEFILL